MHKIAIGDNTDHIELLVFGRTYPDSYDSADGNWLSSQVKIHSGVFSGHVKTDLSLRADEFEPFLKQLELLYKTLKGTAKFIALEEWLEVNITGDGRGHISIKGFIIDNHCDGNQLVFNIQTDQTCLPKTIKGIKELLKEYPAR